MNPVPSIVLAGLALLLVPPSAAARQAENETPEASKPQFSAVQLEQLVAPIALHPDPLLLQILLASTYPLEVAQADRWLQANPGLEAAALEEALREQDWDPSVKAMCGFPPVLKQMGDHLDWTRDMGDAFLGQRAELMDTVQRMRVLALEAGNLETTPEQKIVRRAKTIVIEPAHADVVYVPVYSPVVVYGPAWHSPHWFYPYWYFPPPHGTGFVWFGPALHWRSAFWAHCDWDRHSVGIHAPAFRDFTARTSSRPFPSTSRSASGGRFDWAHDPTHRKGVRYRTPELASNFGAPPGEARVPPDHSRTFERRGTMPPLAATKGGSLEVCVGRLVRP